MGTEGREGRKDKTYWGGRGRAGYPYFFPFACFASFCFEYTVGSSCSRSPESPAPTPSEKSALR
jgi:hypothetical protein